MRRAIGAILLAGPLLWPAFGLAEEERMKEKPRQEIEISSEDRQVIAMLELLQTMELLKEMELLEERETPTDPEDKK